MTTKLYGVVFTPRARQDMAEIWLSIATHNLRAAELLLDGFEKRAVNLSQLPMRGVLRPELGKEIRIVIEGSYLLLYRVSNSDVEILRVVHGAMDLHDLFS